MITQKDVIINAVSGAIGGGIGGSVVSKLKYLQLIHHLSQNH